MEKQEVLCVVSGKVQGVSYRDFVAKHAWHLALVGYVKNLPNFTVEILAQGFPADLEKFLGHARRGPFLARVSHVDVTWRKPMREYRRFEVVF